MLTNQAKQAVGEGLKGPHHTPAAQVPGRLRHPGAEVGEGLPEAVAVLRPLLELLVHDGHDLSEAKSLHTNQYHCLGKQLSVHHTASNEKTLMKQYFDDLSTCIYSIALESALEPLLPSA